jgi:hypothetical protein
MDNFVQYDTIQCIHEGGVHIGILVTTLTLNENIYGLYFYKSNKDINLKIEILDIIFYKPIDIKRCRIVLIEKIYNNVL